MFVPRFGLIKPGRTQTMGFLNENDSLAYFTILGELSSGLSLAVCFFKTFRFLYC